MYIVQNLIKIFSEIRIFGALRGGGAVIRYNIFVKLAADSDC